VSAIPADRCFYVKRRLGGLNYSKYIARFDIGPVTAYPFDKLCTVIIGI
jgi:hypothetical protein